MNERYLDPPARLNYNDLSSYAARLKQMGVDPSVLGMLDNDYAARWGFNPLTTRVADGDWNVRGFYTPASHYDSHGLLNPSYEKSGFGRLLARMRYGETMGPGDIEVSVPPESNVSEQFPTVMHEARHRGLDEQGLRTLGNEEAQMRYSDLASGNLGPDDVEKAKDFLANGFSTPMPLDPEGDYKKFIDYSRAQMAAAKAQSFIPQVDSVPLMQHMMQNPQGLIDPRPRPEDLGPRYKEQQPLLPEVSQAPGRAVTLNLEPRAPAPQSAPVGATTPAEAQGLHPYQMPIPESAMYKIQVPGLDRPVFDYTPPAPRQQPQVDAYPGRVSTDVQGAESAVGLPRPQYQVGEVPGITQRPAGVARTDNLGMSEADAARWAWKDPAAARDNMVAQGSLRKFTGPNGETRWSTRL